MKNLFALILVGSLLLAGCAQKKAVNDQAMKEDVSVVPEQKAPVVADQPTTTEVSESPAPKPQEATVKQPNNKIFFKFDSYLLTEAGRKDLEANALWLRSQPEVRIVIEGNTDERGSDEYNMALGDKRALAARDYLVTLGIAPERISTVSYGEEKATEGAKSEAAWAQDRRDELVIAN
ncbi:MAG: OmpA family protein [Desulfuromonadales bacterium]|jgi:peptidoglycan-associated lipoprotein